MVAGPKALALKRLDPGPELPGVLFLFFSVEKFFSSFSPFPYPITPSNFWDN